jgi:hypothetical protein
MVIMLLLIWFFDLGRSVNICFAEARTSAMTDTSEMPQTKQSKLKAITLGTKEFNCGTASIASRVHTLLHYSFHRHSPLPSPLRPGDTTTVGFGGVFNKNEKGGRRSPRSRQATRLEVVMRGDKPRETRQKRH